jgi:hypothetical protein
VKQLPVYDAAPRAMQALIPKVDESYGFGSLPANLPGSPLLYYTPALTNRGLTVTLEMVFDRFPDDAFQQIGNMLGVAAGIPVFAPASAYLLAGSMIVKLFAKVAEMLVDGRPAFSQSLSISVDRPLYEDTAPGFLLLTPSNVLAANLTNGKFKVDPVRGLVDGTNGAYAGPDPYIVVGLDGTPRPDYADFTPTLATAAVLSRFLHLGDGQPTPTGLIVDALKAYNDIYYRSRADATRKQLDGLDPTSEEALKLKRLLDAYVKNIGNDDLKPKA